KIFQLLRGRQLAVDQQIAGLDEVAALGQRLDGITAIPQHALFAVEKGDRTGRRTGVHVALVERDAARLGAKLRDVDGALALAPRNDRQLEFLRPETKFRDLAHPDV